MEGCKSISLNHFCHKYYSHNFKLCTPLIKPISNYNLPGTCSHHSPPHQANTHPPKPRKVAAYGVHGSRQPSKFLAGQVASPLTPQRAGLSGKMSSSLNILAWGPAT